MRNRIIVVGAGLFGSIIGRWAERHGHSVIWIDDHRPDAGSLASAGLIKPSWLQGFGESGRIGLKVLDELFGLNTTEFVVRPGSLKVNVHHIAPERVMVKDMYKMIHARVVRVGDGWVEYQHHTERVKMLTGTVLVATGAWANELITQMPSVNTLMGTAFMYRGQVPVNTLRVWAPYKQLKVFNVPGNLIWAGDSTGMTPKTYTEMRQKASEDRCFEAVRQETGEMPLLHHKITGRRPVVSGHKEGYFARIFRNTYVATGGGKMGTVLAGAMAIKFLRALDNSEYPHD